MAEQTSYAPGAPCWVDLSSPDPAVAQRFYGALLGWEPVELGPEAMGYSMLALSGRTVAGLGPLMGPGQPSWSVYVKVEDADRTAEAVTAAGGTVLMAPMTVLDQGRMAVFADSTGAAVSVWQPMARHGLDLRDEPGSVSWFELTTRDVDGAARFYADVFGWTTQDATVGDFRYTLFQNGGANVGGMLEPPPGVPPEVPANWMPYVEVTDVDATAGRAAELGGAVLAPPMSMPSAGRFAVLADPHGAFFGVIATQAGA